MKKLLVLLLALSFVGAFVFAEDAAPVPEAKLVAALSGSATVTFGINLDDSSTGIANAIDSNLTLQLVTKATTEKGGKEGETVYGWIKLKDFEIKIDGTLTVAKPGVEAKLFLGPVYINILGDGASTAKTLVFGILNDKDTNGVFDVLGLGVTTSAANVEYKSLEGKQDNADQNGIVIGLTDTSIVDVQIGVNSLYDYTQAAGSVTYSTKVVADGYTLATDGSETFDGTVWTNSSGVVVLREVLVATTKAADPSNTKNIYNFWAAVALKAVAGLTVEVKAGLTTNTPADANPFGLGVKVGYDIALADDIKLTPMVGFDTTFSTTLAWRLSGGLYMTLPGTMLDDWDKFGTKQDIKPGVSVMFATDSKSKSDLTVAMFDGSLIPVVDVVAVAEAFDLSNTMKFALGLFASADFGMIVPYVGFQSQLAPSPIANTILQAGFDLKVITNTTFTVAYKSGNLTPATGDAGKGILTFACKIAY